MRTVCKNNPLDPPDFSGGFFSSNPPRVDDYPIEIGVMKIGIGGIKFSEELVQVSLCTLLPATNSGLLVELIGRITEKRINIPFVCSGRHGRNSLYTFCVAAADFQAVAGILENWLPPEENESFPFDEYSPRFNTLQIVQQVGTLTLFPHKRSLGMLGLAVEVLTSAGIAVHSFCTSISALAVNIDYHRLDAAALVLRGIFELPENHAPFRPEFCVRQLSP